MASKIISKKPANNPKEMTAWLLSERHQFKPLPGGITERVLVETKITGPYYKEMIEGWVEQALEKSGANYVDLSVLDQSELEKFNPKFIVSSGIPYDRFEVTFEDGKTAYQYALPSA